MQSAKGQIVPVWSATGSLEYPKRVPLVPNDITITPLEVAPAARALMALSPPPGDTKTPSGRPISAATSFRTDPKASDGPTRAGR